LLSDETSFNEPIGLKGFDMIQRVQGPILGVMLISALQFAVAAEQPGKPAELVAVQDYLRYVALHNAGLKSSFEQWQAALQRVPQARVLPDPKISYGYYIEEVETRVGPQRQKFGISQVFPWFGKIEARTDTAAAKAQATRQRYEAAKLKLFNDVKQAFYEFAYLESATTIAGENLELIKHFEDVSRTKYTTAAAGHPDLIRAQVEMARLEDILESLRDMRKPSVARINAVLNRPTDANLAWPGRKEFEPIQLSLETVMDMLREKNPELAGLSFEISAARSKIELAKKQFYPDIGVGLNYIQTERAMSSGVKDSGKDPIVLMFTMNLPIWRDSYRAAEQQARAETRKFEQQRIETENDILARAAQVLYDYQDSIRKIHLYKDNLIPKAEELLQSSETAYKAGTVDFLSLINAQQMLIGYRLSYERALANNQQKLARLEMLVGTELGRK